SDVGHEAVSVAVYPALRQLLGDVCYGWRQDLEQLQMQECRGLVHKVQLVVGESCRAWLAVLVDAMHHYDSCVLCFWSFVSRLGHDGLPLNAEGARRAPCRFRWHVSPAMGRVVECTLSTGD